MTRTRDTYAYFDILMRTSGGLFLSTPAVFHEIAKVRANYRKWNAVEFVFWDVLHRRIDSQKFYCSVCRFAEILAPLLLYDTSFCTNKFRIVRYFLSKRVTLCSRIGECHSPLIRGMSRSSRRFHLPFLSLLVSFSPRRLRCLLGNSLRLDSSVLLQFVKKAVVLALSAPFKQASDYKRRRLLCHIVALSNYRWCSAVQVTRALRMTTPEARGVVRKKGRRAGRHFSLAMSTTERSLPKWVTASTR